VLFLRGGVETLRRCRPVICGEFNAGLMPRFGHTFLDAAELVMGWGYRLFKFISDEQLVEIHEPKPVMGDAVFVPEERGEGFLERLGVVG
jgi:hypothetical protein